MISSQDLFEFKISSHHNLVSLITTLLTCKSRLAKYFHSRSLYGKKLSKKDLNYVMGLDFRKYKLVNLNFRCITLVYY